jgi:hypothetical protein
VIENRRDGGSENQGKEGSGTESVNSAPRHSTVPATRPYSP